MKDILELAKDCGVHWDVEIQQFWSEKTNLLKLVSALRDQVLEEVLDCTEDSIDEDYIRNKIKQMKSTPSDTNETTK